MNSRWLQVVRQDGSRRRSGSASAAHGHAPWAYVERLEERQLLTLFVVPISPVEGSLFQGKVATFIGNEVPAATILDFSATINWGDGTATTSGSIIPGSPSGYVVNGSHTYAKEGTYNLSVVLSGIGGVSVSAVGTATVADAPVIVTAGGIAATANAPFSGQVATFTDAGPDLPSQYVVTITWGDGSTSPGTVTGGAPGTSFNVAGTHTYISSGSETYSVSVTNLAGTTGNASGKAVIADPLPVVIAQTIVPAAGLPFTGVVATFTDANPALTNTSFVATIDWGDSSPTSAGTIMPLSTGGFSVTGTHTYNTTGNFTDKITVYRLPDNMSAQATGTAVVAPTTSITGTGTTITPLVGVEFSGVVASFNAIPPGGINNFVASIDWGDHSAPSAGTIQLVSPGQYNVLGSHTYATPSGGTPSNPYTVTVTVVQAFSNGTPTTVIKSQAVVQAQPFTGRLDPLSDTGESNSDGITNINQPTFSGTAQPYSLIQIYSKLPQQLGPILQGSTIAGADGSWSLATGPLADGTYAISATVTPPGGAPVSSVALPPLVIDTVAPRVTGVVYSRAEDEVEVVFRDDASGMNLESLRNPQNYNLIGHPQRRYASTSLPIITTIQIVPNDPQAVVLTLNQ